MPAPEPGQSWGILGGLFDPVHLGHLNLASQIRKNQSLDGVLLVPSFDHPHRPGEARASFDDRCTMILIAIAGDPALQLSDIERQTRRPNYTLDTIRALKKQHDQVRFSFLLGADNLKLLPTWHRWEELLDEVPVLAGGRPNAAADDLVPLVREKVIPIEIEEVDISSTAIRAAVAGGENFKNLCRMTPMEVARYILDKKLYS